MAHSADSDNRARQNEGGERPDASLNNETVYNSESTQLIGNQHDHVIIHKNDVSPDEQQEKTKFLRNILESDQSLDKGQFNRSISLNFEDHRSKGTDTGRRSLTIIEATQDDNLMSNDSTRNNNNNDNNRLNIEQDEQIKGKSDDHSPVSRLLNGNCEVKRNRIELLGELISSEKLDPVPAEYDQMKDIISATERNDRFQSDPDGKRLLELTTAARSNLNIDLYNLDVEIQRQFGLHSVEVTGDGACAFRAILISGLQQPDVFHSELRGRAIEQVLSDMAYYSTVLRPGEKVSEAELRDWATSMADPNTYGDEMANMAVADYSHIQLVIFRAGELLTVVNPRDGHVEHRAFLVNVGTHYKALVPQCELDTARQNSERLSKHS